MSDIRGFVEQLDKSALRDQLVSKMTEQLEQIRHSAHSAAAEATHEESRAENDKDTRGLETSYLARGQAERALALEEDIHALRRMPLRSFESGGPVAGSALVVLVSTNDEQTSAERVVFIVGWGGGITLSLGGYSIQAVTPVSPLGRALLRKSEGDEISFVVRGRRVAYEVDLVS